MSVAQQKWLEFITLTDHDIISDDFQGLAEKSGIKSCQSVEISANNTEQNKHLHLTCYARAFNEDMQSVLQNTLTQKQNLIVTQVEHLNSLGFHIHINDLYKFYANMWRSKGSLNKFDIARFIFSHDTHTDDLIAITGEDNIDTEVFYMKYFKQGWAQYENYSISIPEYEPSVEVCGTLAKSNNAILSLAHPNFTFRKWIDEFLDNIEYYVSKWVNAIEINSKASVDWVQAILEVREKYNLLLTFGSDCHELGIPDSKHGDFWELNIYLSPVQVEKEVEKILAWLG